MARKTVGAGPIISLLSDFGLRDSYVAEMKLALLRHAPLARLIDVTHAIEPQDVLGGSIQLERAIAAADAGTYHLAVVDPGVGSNRRILIVKLARQTIVCPDNGLITWPWRRLGPGKAYELLWRTTSSPSPFQGAGGVRVERGRTASRQASNTFHGRDIMAPAIGMLAAGATLSNLARRVDDLNLLDMHPADPAAHRGRIIHIDHFGNATTNIEMFEGHAIIRIGRRSVGPIRHSYSDVAPGEPLALLGSSGLLEIAVRDGSAAKKLRLKIGDEVTLVR
jgi:S-adenosylmethionine hydrolase